MIVRRLNLDLAIGALPEGATVEEDLKSVIVSHWSRDAEYLQGWEGVIDSIVEDSSQWREEVSWGYNDDGEEIAFIEEEEEEE